MKEYVTYERGGELVSFILGPADGPPVAIVTEPGNTSRKWMRRGALSN